MKSFALGEVAAVDFEEISLYLAENALSQRSAVLAALVGTFRLLGDQPLLGRLVGPSKPGMRKLPASGKAKSYVIYYWVRDGIPSIYRILHGARDQAASLGNSPSA